MISRINLVAVVFCAAAATEPAPSPGGMAVGAQAAEQARSPEAVYPGAEWERRAAGDLGLDAGVLREMDALMKKDGANGVLICRGYLVAEWNYGGKAQDRYEVQSVTKAITSMVLGLALKDKLVPDLDARVKKHHPGFEAGPFTSEITFRHLVTATSGIRSTITPGYYVDPGGMKPGLESRYHNDHTYHLGEALKHLYGGAIADVVRQRVLKPLQAQDDIQWKGEGFGFSHWSARDLARVGVLYLNEGRWKGEEILPAEFARECRQPIPVPVKEWSLKPPPDRDLSRFDYGLAWCGFRGAKDGTIWHMCGKGDQFCAVIPERQLVMAKVKFGSIGVCEGPFAPLLLKLAKEGAKER